MNVKRSRNKKKRIKRLSHICRSVSSAFLKNKNAEKIEKSC